MTHIDPSTITRGITYLYRWWVQAELRIVPEAYVRREGEATLVCPKWVLVGSPTSVKPEEVRRISDDLTRPAFAFCPRLPYGLPGMDLSDQTGRGLTPEIDLVRRILARYQDLLQELGEENPERDEWWRTRDAGEFKIWKRPRVHRLLLYPAPGDTYGFRITPGDDDSYFAYRSRTCREEGRIVGRGTYKLSEHGLPTGRKVTNVDLLFADGKVLLLRLLPTGAGFKVFPRRVPGFEGSLE